MLDSLEKEVGFPLLIRSKDAIRTTDEGEQLLYYCRQIIKNSNDFQETVDAINGLLSGSIHIGAYNSTLLSSVPALIAKFCRAYSKINISVQEYSHSDLAHSLINGNIDSAAYKASRRCHCKRVCRRFISSDRNLSSFLQTCLARSKRIRKTGRADSKKYVNKKRGNDGIKDSYFHMSPARGDAS